MSKTDDQTLIEMYEHPGPVATPPATSPPDSVPRDQSPQNPPTITVIAITSTTVWLQCGAARVRCHVGDSVRPRQTTAGNWILTLTPEVP